MRKCVSRGLGTQMMVAPWVRENPPRANPAMWNRGKA
jgi:hypothetical protein